jgi:16S rRNA (uracil1498-N3)-methyltransferase
MHLFYSEEISGEIYTLPPEESKHCIRVLRLKKGDIIHLTDGKGNLYETKIIDDDLKYCTLKIMNTQHEFGRRKFSLHIAVAPIKNISRFEWFLEKATEIGIDVISPLICEHSERRVVPKERLNKLITAAMKQSLKAYHPILNEAVNFQNFVSQDIQEEKYIAYCSENYMDQLKQVYEPGKNALIMIGPEGDFSIKEIEMAVKAGFKPVSLGPDRLRTETAALVACHTVNLLNQ